MISSYLQNFQVKFLGSRVFYVSRFKNFILGASSKKTLIREILLENLKLLEVISLGVRRIVVVVVAIHHRPN